MSLNFQPKPSSSFDANHQLSIPHPRIVPAVLADGREGTEYQFAFIRNGEALGGLGLVGPDEVVQKDGRREWVFTLDLGPERLIRSVLDLKRVLNDTDDDLSFVRGLAWGLVAAFAGRTDNRTDVKYRVVTTRDGLTRAGVSVPDNVGESSTSGICLAEVAVPARRT